MDPRDKREDDAGWGRAMSDWSHQRRSPVGDDGDSAPTQKKCGSHNAVGSTLVTCGGCQGRNRRQLWEPFAIFRYALRLRHSISAHQTQTRHYANRLGQISTAQIIRRRTHSLISGLWKSRCPMALPTRRQRALSPRHARINETLTGRRLDSRPGSIPAVCVHRPAPSPREAQREPQAAYRLADGWPHGRCRRSAAVSHNRRQRANEVAGSGPTTWAIRNYRPSLIAATPARGRSRRGRAGPAVRRASTR